jgi:hypothetical protein
MEVGMEPLRKATMGAGDLLLVASRAIPSTA